MAGDFFCGKKNMAELLYYNPEHDDPSLKPITDAWWNHLLQVHNGFPPHPRSWYRMPACPDWGPRSATRYDEVQSNLFQEACMEEKFGIRISPDAIIDEIESVQKTDLSLSRHIAALALAGLNPGDVDMHIGTTLYQSQIETDEE